VIVEHNAEPLRNALIAAQTRARHLRCEAFVDYIPVVAGLPVRPVCLASFNKLVAFENAFVTGGEVRFDDIVNFIWVHHPQFGQFNRRDKKRVTLEVYAALRPALPTLNDLLILLSQLPHFRVLRRMIRPTPHERVAIAIREIRRLIAEATEELPSGDDSGEPIPFAFQAHILNLFRRTLGMSFEETRQLPLRQLAQHYREIVYRESKGKALLLTKEEAAIWREHLGEHTAA
jgi:hypothetical protein